MEKGGELIALNSHDVGVEQIFIRAYPFAQRPHWEVTITSFERITDLVKYRIGIPNQLRQQLQENTLRYISPVYFTYRDDNLR